MCRDWSFGGSFVMAHFLARFASILGSHKTEFVVMEPKERKRMERIGATVVKIEKLCSKTG
jgi:hypothetical protein